MRPPPAAQRGPAVCSPALRLFVGMVAGISGVQMGPGATAFTRMPFSASSWARALVKLWMPALVVAVEQFGDGLTARTGGSVDDGGARLHVRNRLLA